MARLLVLRVDHGVDLPGSVGLLPHTLVEGAPDALLDDHGDVDLVLLDARGDLPAARGRAGEIASRGLPLLLLVDAAALAVLSRDWGAGDFVLESAPAAELDARLRLLATRTGQEGVIEGGPVVIDETAYTVQLAGQPLDLTYTEFELLKYLVLHPGRVLTREHLLSEVWGYDYYGGTRTVDVHIRRLRAKLGPEHEGHIGTVRNVGYRFQTSR